MSSHPSRWGVSYILALALGGAVFAQETPQPDQAGVGTAEDSADPTTKYADLRKSRNRAIKVLADRYAALTRVQEWTAASGKFKAKARYVEHDPDMKWVKLSTTTGSGENRVANEATIELSKLDRASQSKVRQIAALQKKLDELAATETIDASGTEEFGPRARDSRGQMSEAERGNTQPTATGRSGAGDDRPPMTFEFQEGDGRRGSAGLAIGGSTVEPRVGRPGQFGQFGQPRVEPGKVVLESPKNHGGFFGFAFAPDGQLLAGGTGVVTMDAGSGQKVAGGGEVVLWDSHTGELVKTLGDHGARVNWLAYSADGRSLASASKSNGVIKVWDTQSGSLKHTLEMPGGKILAAAFSPDGKSVVAVAETSRSVGKSTIQEGGDLVAWDADSGAKTWSVPNSNVQQISISPDGRILAAYSIKVDEAKPDDQGNTRSKYIEPRVTLFDITSGNENAKFDLESPLSVKFLLFLPTSDRLAVLGAAGLSQFDTRSGQMHDAISWDTQRRAFSSAALSAEGQTLARAWSDWVELVDVSTGKVEGVRKVQFPNHWFNVCFSPDLKRIACSQQGAAIIDIAELEPPAEASSR